MPITVDPRYSGCPVQRYGPGRGDLPPLLEVAGRPDANRLARPRRPPRRRPATATSACASHERRDAADEPERHAHAREASAPRSGSRGCGERQGVGRCASTHLLDGDVVDAGARAAAAPLDSDTRTSSKRETADVGRAPRPVARRIGRAEQRHDRRADGRRPCAAARCRPTPSARAARASASRSASSVGGADARRAARRRDDRARQLPPRPAPTARPTAARAARGRPRRPRRSDPAASACSATPRPG